MNTLAYYEIQGVVRYWLIWITLGWQDIKLKYRRSSLGPFWITLSMAITVCAMGFLYSHLFKINFKYYFPYLAIGIISWTFISSLLIESTHAFVDSENYIKNLESFYSIFIMRVILRNLIVLFHNLIVLIPLFLIFKLSINFKIFFLIPGIILICLNALFWGTILAILGTRFRDFYQIMVSFLQIIFFITPIAWLPKLLPISYQWIVLYNPFEKFISLLRDPIMSQTLSIFNVIMVLIITLIGFLLFSFYINKYKYKIVFWL